MKLLCILNQNQACDILLDERRFLLLLSGLESICNPIRLIARLMIDSADVRCIKMKNNVDFIVLKCREETVF